MSSDADNSNLLTQAIAEYMRRVDADEAVDREQFLQANAQVSAELRQYLDNVALVERMAGPTPAEQSQHPTKDGARRETVATSQGGDSVPDKKGTVTDGQITGRFGRYKIEKTLGEGAMGTVFLARDSQLDRQVALKVPKFKDDDTEMMERFYREARAAARLRHRHICPVHDIGEIDGIKYISIGYVDGHPLSSFVSADHPPAERNVAIIVRKLALALDVAHRDGIIHRDLKPANVMVDKKSEPVIMDFGLARQLNKQENERLTQTGTIMGSPAYMSPEQVHADNEKIGRCSDIYSLGVMLYELLTGHLPFEGSIAAVIGQILMKEPRKPTELRPDLDPRLEAICEKMMAKEIDDRYASMKEVADALTAFLKNEGLPGAQRSVGKLESFAPVESKEVETQSGKGRRTVARKKERLQSADTFATGNKTRGGRQAADLSKRQTAFDRLKNLPGKTKAIAGGLAGLLLVLGITIIIKFGNQTVEVNSDKPITKIDLSDGKIEIETGGPAPPAKTSQLPPPGVPLPDRLDDLTTGEWIDAFQVDPPENDGDQVKLKDGVLELKDHTIALSQLSGRNMIVRAKVQKLTGQNVGIGLRHQATDTGSDFYSVWMNSPTSIGLGRMSGTNWKALKNRRVPQGELVPDQEGFFDLAFAAIGDRLGMYFNGKKYIEVTDEEFATGAVRLISTRGRSSFKDVQVMQFDAPASDLAVGQWVRLLENETQLREWQAINCKLEFSDGVVSLSDLDKAEKTEPGDGRLLREFDTGVKRFMLHVRHKKLSGFMAGEDVQIGSRKYSAAHFGQDKHELWTRGVRENEGSSKQSVYVSNEGFTDFAEIDYVVIDGEYTAYLNGKKMHHFSGPVEPLTYFQLDVRNAQGEWRDIAIMRLSDEQVAAIRAGRLPLYRNSIEANLDRFALFFNGVDDRVEIPPLGLKETSTFTFEAWTTPEAQRSGRWGNLFDCWGNWGQRSERGGLRVSTERNGDVTSWGAWVHDAETGRSGEIGSPVRYGRRTHLCATINGRDMLMFVDGELVRRTELPTDYRPVDKPVLIGAVRNENFILSHYCGTIDEVRLSRSARYTENFVPPSQFAKDDETIALYHFDRGEGGRLVDSSGNGLHGVIHGATWVPAGYRPRKRWRITSIAPNHRVYCVAWHPQQDLVAVASDRFVRLLEPSESGFKLRQLLEGHTSTVHAIAWSPDGSKFASASRDSTIRLWDVNGKSIAHLSGHRGTINDIAWSPDGNWIASAGIDDTVRLWKADGQPGITVKADASNVRRVVWSHDSQQFASIGDDRIVKIWNRNGSPARQLEPLESRGLSLDWSSDGERIVAGDESGHVRLFSAADGKLLGEVKLPDDHWSDQVYDLAFSPDGKQIAIGTEISLRVWNGEDKETAAVTIEPIDYDYDVNGIRTLSWSPAGDRIVTGGDDASVRIFELNEKMPLPTVGPILRGNHVFATTVAWSPDGTRLAAGLADWTVRTWTQDGTPDVVARGHERISWGPIRTVGWNADGNSLYSCGRFAHTWDAEGKPIKKFTGHHHRTLAAASNPVKPMIASGGYSEDKKIRLWSPDDSGTIDVTIDGLLSNILTLAWSPDGTRFVSGGGRHREKDGTLVKDYDVRVWSVEGTQQHALTGHTDRVVDVDWSLDGNLIASASTDRTVRLWHTDGTVDKVLKNPGWVRGVSFSPDSQRLATACSDDRVHIWSVAGEDELTLQRHREDITSVDWNPQDDNQVASTANDGMICIWNVRQQRPERILYPLRDGESLMLDENGRLLQGDAGALQNEIVFLVEDQPEQWTMLRPAEFWQRGIENHSVSTPVAQPKNPVPAQPKEPAPTQTEFVPPVIATLGGHQSSIRGVEFTVDAQHLVSVDSGGAVRQWNGQTGGVTAQYAAGECFGMAVSPDGKVLATTHREPNLVKLWSLADQRQLGVLKTNRPGSMLTKAVAFSPNGASLAAVSYDNFARIWELKTGVQRHQFLARDPKEEHGASGAGVVYTPDSRFVLVRRAATKLPAVYAFDLKRRKIDDSQSFKTTHGTYGQLAISPDGQQLALTNYVGPTEFFKLGEESEPVGISMSGGQYVCGYAPDGKSIAIGSTGRVVLFDAATHEQMAELEMPNKDARVHSIDFAPDGEYLVAGESDGKDVPRPSDYKIRIWRLNPDPDATTESSQPSVNQWVDIIPDVNPEQDAVACEWAKIGDTLQLIAGDGQNWLKLPAKPKGSFEIEAEFTRHQLLPEHGVGFLMPVGGQRVSAVFGGWGLANSSGLTSIDGVDAGRAENPTHTRQFKVEQGKRHTVRVRVEADATHVTIQGFADGKALFNWRGLLTQVNHSIPLPEGRVLLSCYDKGKTTFHKLRWRNLDPTAEQPVVSQKRWLRPKVNSDEIKRLHVFNLSKGKFGRPPDVKKMEKFVQDEVAERKADGRMSSKGKFEYRFNAAGKIIFESVSDSPILPSVPRRRRGGGESDLGDLSGGDLGGGSQPKK